MAKLSKTWAASLLIPAFLLGQSAAAGTAEDIKALRGEVSALKQGQDAMRKDVEEIKKLVQAMPVPKPAPPSIQKIDAAVAIGSNPPKGKKDATLTLIEFSDFQCPFCGRHAKDTLPQLVKEYVDTGKLRYAFRDFPLEQIHPNAVKAAEAARCAAEQDKDKFWPMHDQLFANQKDLQAEKLPEYAKAVGLDDAKLKACVDSGKYTSAVRDDLAVGTKLDIHGTPTFVLGVSNGDQVKNAVLIRGAQSFDSFKAEINKLLSPPTEPAKENKEKDK